MAYEKIPLHLNEDQHRFEMNIDGEYAVINYRQTDDVVNLIHTEVPEELEGKGVAAALVTKTLQYLDDHQLKMMPLCSYVQNYLHRHPEWCRIVANE
jgi:predicted GNAT family acetyltransferase